SWIRTSERLTTPTGQPAASITGAALKPLFVKKTMASRTEAPSRIDTGLLTIRSAAVSACRVTHGRVAVAFMVVLHFARIPVHDRRRTLFFNLAPFFKRRTFQSRVSSLQTTRGLEPDRRFLLR